MKQETQFSLFQSLTSNRNLGLVTFPKPGEAYEVYSVADVLEVINVGLKTQLSPTKVGMLMSKMGFKKVRTKKARGYMAYRYSMEEICRNRKEKADEGEEKELPF